jgi:HSP20 family molecular chaperone IbpA
MRQDPWTQVVSFLQEVDQEITRQTQSPVEQWESDGALALLLREPGINQSNTQVTLEGRTLVIVTEPKSPIPEGFKRVSGLHSYAKQTRRYKFSDKYDLDNLTAKIQDGQLLVTVPRVTVSSRTVPIQ